VYLLYTLLYWEAGQMNFLLFFVPNIVSLLSTLLLLSVVSELSIFYFTLLLLFTYQVALLSTLLNLSKKVPFLP
jgi:hypothetical protein